MNKENGIKSILDSYLPQIEQGDSILKGNLLDEKENRFVVENANAFIIGLIADQSVKAEIAWSLPYRLKMRINSFDFDYIVNSLTIEDLEKIIKEKPALHRYPHKMATYIYKAMKKILREYNGDASEIWNGQSADVIVRRFEEFDGISHKKASLGTLLLIRDLDKEISNKQYIDIAYDVHIRRIFLRMGLVDKDTQDNVIEAARKINPDFPGELTTSFWAIGRHFCHPTNPDCDNCPLNECCNEHSHNLKKKVGV